FPPLDLERGSRYWIFETGYIRDRPLVVYKGHSSRFELVLRFGCPLAGLPELQLEADVCVCPLHSLQVDDGVHLPFAGLRPVGSALIMAGVVDPDLSNSSPRQGTDPRQGLSPSFFFTVIAGY